MLRHIARVVGLGLGLWGAGAVAQTPPALLEAVQDFKLPERHSHSGKAQPLWMTNYLRVDAPAVTHGGGTVLRDRRGEPFTMSETDTRPLAVSREAFCHGANNSILLVQTPAGHRAFATVGPIGQASADCHSLFRRGLNAKIIDIINRQSFRDVTQCAPYGLDATGHALVPFRSAAVLKGGSIPLNTVLFIRELVGRPLSGPDHQPLRAADGQPLVHDGYLISVDHVNRGKMNDNLPEELHVDVFAGSQQNFLGNRGHRIVQARIVDDAALKAILLQRPRCP